jgi:hypothetical protein
MKHQNGYLEQIKHWNSVLNSGLNVLDFVLVHKAAEKLTYFSAMHNQLIAQGKMVPGQSGTISDPEEDTINDPLYALLPPAGGYGH